MAALQQRLAASLGDPGISGGGISGGGISVDVESDGAVTVFYDGTLTSLRVVTITEDLDLVLLTQIVARDLPLTEAVREQVTARARDLNFGSVRVIEKESARESAVGSGTGSPTGDVILRYYFPGDGLADAALRTLIMLVLDTGAEIRRALTA